MRLTKQTDFALRTLMYLANEKRERRIFAQEIADIYEMPLNHLTKIIHKLGKLGYINTYRGRNGGIELAKPQEQIFIRQVIVDFEPTLNSADCGHCVLTENCELKYYLADASEAFLDSLGNKSLADMSYHNKTA